MRAAAATAVPIAAAAALALGHVGPGITWLAPVRLRWAPRLSGLGRAGHLALTFDDGPHPFGTPAILTTRLRQPVLWSAWGRDWRPQATPDSVALPRLAGELDRRSVRPGPLTKHWAYAC